MTPGPSPIAARTAIREGWPPPLAWDDDTIDDPAAEPYRPRISRTSDQLATASAERLLVDEVVVELALAGQRVTANRVERAAIAARWLADGRSLKSLNIAQGWNLERDRRMAAA